MTRLSSRLTERIRGTEMLDRALRYNARHYEPVRKLLGELDGMDRSARRDLSDRLTRRALEWAADTPSGLPADVPLADRPFTEKSDLRDHPERLRVRGLLRARASTSGATGIPVRVQRSLRSVASEQAFIDDMLGVWNLTFRTARIARLRADRVKPVTDHEPPYGVRTHGGRQLVLSSNHLSPTTVRWFHDELRRFAPDVLYTHPSHGEALARFMQKFGLSIPIAVVLTSSESLEPSGRLLMEHVFQATVVDYYGQAERVAFAAGLAGGASYFNPAYGRVELLPLDEAEAPTGCRAFEIRHSLADNAFRSPRSCSAASSAAWIRSTNEGGAHRYLGFAVADVANTSPGPSRRPSPSLRNRIRIPRGTAGDGTVVDPGHHLLSRS